ncbi:integrase, partial [Salmonella enterica subsp. arizonae]|nr:integrase [Salmonella enterica]ECE6098528.1 integrase [Salmonella enterica subsp. arizonae]ECT9555410.1 integrase [Salmonella enterica subsp. arizonae serovar 41:z4,z23:-]
RKTFGLMFNGEPSTLCGIRSLAASLYSRKVNDNFAQHLPGHKADSMVARDSRGKE